MLGFQGGREGVQLEPQAGVLVPPLELAMFVLHVMVGFVCKTFARKEGRSSLRLHISFMC